MQEIESVEHLDEVHRFFPEWADRPLTCEWLPEFDRNSYMAGGYPEEFGHRTGVDGTLVDAHLTEDPERCPQWKVQAGGLHPGYPECPRPSDRDHDRTIWAVPPPRVGLDGRSLERADFGDAAHGSGNGMSTVQVGQNGRSRHGWLVARLATLWVGMRARRRDLGGIL